MVHFAAEGRRSLAGSLVRRFPPLTRIILGEECYELADDLLPAPGCGARTMLLQESCVESKADPINLHETSPQQASYSRATETIKE